jgi:V/A-type H+-transporting ATPase subunit K
MNIALIGATCVLGLGAIGSAVGAYIAGMAAIGSWKRSYLNNRPASFLLVAFAGAPLTQTIYSFILMTKILNSGKDPTLLMWAGILAGLAEGISAAAQGAVAAAGCEAYGETGKGFANYIIVVGLVETVALFVLAFTFSAV